MQLPILNIKVDKSEFLKTDALNLMLTLKAETKPLWGMMTAHHMIEHLCYIIENSVGRRKIETITPEEKLPKFKQFLMSPYGFTQNFKFPLLPENDLVPLRTKDIAEAIELYVELVGEMIELINQPDFTTTPHPMYGPLNKEETLMFHYKHLQHHLSQFGLVSINYSEY